MKKLSCMVVATFILLSGVAQAKTVSIGSNPQGSMAYSVAAGISKVALEKGGIQARVVPQGGPVVTLPLVNNGELDFSISVSPVTAFASKGGSMFKGRPQNDVRVVAAMISLRVGFFVRKGSGITSLEGLKNKKVASKFTKQKINHAFARAIMATVGMDYGDVVGVPVPNGVRGVDDFMAGKVDATCFSLLSGKVAQANASVGGIRILSVPKTPEALAAMRKITPGTLITTLESAPNLPGILETTHVLTAPFIINAGTKTPADVVYKLVKALYQNKSILVKSHKAFNGFIPDKMHPDLGIPYHEGALKFYREKGI